MPPPSRGRSQLHPSSSSSSSSTARSLSTSAASAHMRLPPLSQVPAHLTRLAYHALQVFRGLSLKAKAILFFFAVAYLALIVTVLRIGTHGILEYLSGFALYFSHSSFGPSLLILIITVLSFPPLVGYGTSITVCGLSFGSPESGEGHGLLLAWAIAAGGCLTGATASFLVGRWGLARYGDRFDWIREVRGGKEWRAMEKAVERKGWKMAILIRLCPFPFVYSNLFFSSLRPSSVSLPLFIFATLCTTPKLLIHVFVGSKAFEAIQSGKNGQAASKSWLSVASIIGASLLGAITSWYIYRETKKVLDSFVEEDEEEARMNAEEEGRRRGAHQEWGNGHASRQPEGEGWGWLDAEEGDSQKRRTVSQSSRNGLQRQPSGSASFTLGDLDGEDAQGSDGVDDYLYGGKDDAKRSLLGRSSRRD
ncbi:hypothetical protein BCV69DRAFT_282802 [Microstroma glucosiphilum]|uniref:Golgi apparatus membrane protein TVP38 n=1 Tax=Pseudomicrostroma glucosiphilum TaxID=1684307 RepID=A0A316U896_9BASI|nr:hypothetical protein BCV69DRAFT_282802 [Pseudomicrostroma glucosiphilum]PWN20593.1 hypothetical protein BCV69DRAFT_282802 [Pseudomicrostroma glucosiphilum]